jgi:Leucine-rich repeat (LRR) protein
MKNNINCLTILKFALVLAVSLSFFSAIAQPEDKSYLKLSDPTSKTHINNFIPNSRYGPVVTPTNLAEALKNPTFYKSARFTNAGLTEFPEQIFLFPNIEELDMSGNSLTALPARLTELKQLKELHVNKNKLTSLGSEITMCSKLEVLQIQNNPLESISKEIGKMASLREITIGEIAKNCVIPLELWSLTNLTKIKITNAYLTEIPAAVSGLKQLNELCLANNAISEVPEGLYSLTKITYINLGYNKINSLSPSIKALENLDYLGVYYNPLATFPEEIANLKKLSFLSCWKTNLSPNEIEKARKKLPVTKVHDTETDIH